VRGFQSYSRRLFILPHCSVQNVQEKQAYMCTLVHLRWCAMCRHGSQCSDDCNWLSLFPHLRHTLASPQSDLCRVRIFAPLVYLIAESQTSVSIIVTFVFILVAMLWRFFGNQADWSEVPHAWLKLAVRDGSCTVIAITCRFGVLIGSYCSSLQ
jgi:hypothetical protein